MEEAHAMFTVLAVAMIATIVILTIQAVQFFLEHERREQLRDLYDSKQDKFLNVYTKSDNTKHRKIKQTKRKK